MLHVFPLDFVGVPGAGSLVGLPHGRSPLDSVNASAVLLCIIDQRVLLLSTKLWMSIDVLEKGRRTLCVLDS